MKIECLVEKLLSIVAKAEKVSGKNLSLPVLSSIVFDVGKSSVTVRATNLETGLEAELPARVAEGHGSRFALPAGTIVQFLSNLNKDASVVLELKGKNIKISSGETEAEINTIECQDFPNIQKLKKGRSAGVRAGDLAKGIRSVVFSASTSSIKPELSSVYVFSDNGNLVFVSTDSFRLAEKKVKAPGAPSGLSAIIPAKNATDVSRLIEDYGDEDVEVVFEKNQIAFFCGSVYLVSRIVEGSFPDYKQIVPKDGKTAITVLRDDFTKAVRTITAFSDSSNQIYFKISPIKKNFEIFSKNASVGSGAFRVKGAMEGDEVEISFNHRYINDSLQIIGQDSISLFLNGHGKPMIMRGVSDSTFMYLVMPMNK